MSSKELDDLARLTTVYLKLVSDKYGGETTLNELRVINKVVVLHFYGKTTSVTELSRELSIPKSTVSRSVLNLTQQGHLKETDHPDDRRKRIVSLSVRSVDDLEQEAKVLTDVFKLQPE